MKRLFPIIAIAVSCSTLPVVADGFFQASLTRGLAIYDRNTEIHGLSLNIWGENPQQGVSLGFINGSTGDSGGFSWAILANYDDSYTGVQWGFANFSKQHFVGWQSGVVNADQGDFKGLQFGILNYTENLHGVQIGLLNLAENNAWFSEFPDQLAKGVPIVNWSF